MTLVPTTAASAVYHDALSTARGFRTLCFLVLLFALLVQLGLFFTARYGENVVPVQQSRAAATGTASVPTGVATTQGVEVDRNADGTIEEVETDTDAIVTRSSVSSSTIKDWVYAALYVTLWAGMVFAILLSLTLAFATLVMLNGRTVGVSNMAKAFLYSLLLLMLLIPWQAILNHPTLRGGMFHLPGALYIWPELDTRAKFANGDIMGWVRFVFWPLAALVLLFVVYGKSGRGIKEALGEDLVDHDVPMDRPVS